MPPKIAVAALTPEELCQKTGLAPAYRGRQVFGWVAKGVPDFASMRNIGKDAQQLLEQKATLWTCRVTQELRDDDGTLKIQVTLADGRAVEAVLMTDREGRKTACVSCQAGCAMGCAFCKTGTLGLGRNLADHEIVEQFLLLERLAGRLDNIVFMGMGEPLQNLGAIRKAVAVLTDQRGRALSSRRITVSTCGLVDGIYALADDGPQVRLALSLTTADQALRERLMPVAKANPLDGLKKALSYYATKTGQRVTLEAALMAGVNTGRDDAEKLADFARATGAHVNLIPWNPVPGLGFATPSRNEAMAFLSWLTAGGINATLRTKRGGSVGAACGQLGSSVIQKKMLENFSEFGYT